VVIVLPTLQISQFKKKETRIKRWKFRCSAVYISLSEVDCNQDNLLDLFEREKSYCLSKKINERLSVKFSSSL